MKCRSWSHHEIVLEFNPIYIHIYPSDTLLQVSYTYWYIQIHIRYCRTRLCFNIMNDRRTAIKHGSLPPPKVTRSLSTQHYCSHSTRTAHDKVSGQITWHSAEEGSGVTTCQTSAHFRCVLSPSPCHEDLSWLMTTQTLRYLRICAASSPDSVWTISLFISVPFPRLSFQSFSPNCSYCFRTASGPISRYHWPVPFLKVVFS